MDLCKQPVSAYLDRFGFRSDLLKAMYAVTDGVSGLTATWDMPGSGLNFLYHNMVQPKPQTLHPEHTAPTLHGQEVL